VNFPSSVKPIGAAILAAPATLIVAPAVHLEHFPAMVAFAALVSAALGCVGRNSTTGRIKYAILSFLLFLAVGIGLAWLMFPFSK
jgi:hypothetical protein